MSIDDDHVRMIWAYAWEHASAQEDVTKVWDECRGSASAAPAWRVWGSFASAGSVSGPLLRPGDAPSGPPPGRGAPSGGGTLPAEGAAAAAAVPPDAAAREFEIDLPQVQVGGQMTKHSEVSKS